MLRTVTISEMMMIYFDTMILAWISSTCVTDTNMFNSNHTYIFHSGLIQFMQMHKKFDETACVLSSINLEH